MTNNERIYAEIQTRIENLKNDLPELSSKFTPLLEYYESQSIHGLAYEMIDELSLCIDAWSDGNCQAAGIEWYYDGSDQPRGLGYMYKVKKTPDPFVHKCIGSEATSARSDFDGKVKFDEMISPDTGDFNIAKACFPMYECDLARLGGEKEEDILEMFMELFTLRMFLSLHLAFKHLSSSKLSQPKSPKYFFANNHDWSPFLIYIFDEKEESITLKELPHIETKELKSWIKKLDNTAAAKERKYDFFKSVEKGSMPELEKNLLQIPFLTNKEGITLEFKYKHLDSFAENEISDPALIKEISFEAFLHYFYYVLKQKKSIMKTPLTYLFINNPDRAYDIVMEVFEQDPKEKENDLWRLGSCIRDCIRWSNEDRLETRFHNITWSLNKDKYALQKMQDTLDS